MKTGSGASANSTHSSTKKDTGHGTPSHGVDALVRQNVKLVKRSVAGPLGITALCNLRDLTANFGFSMALGDLIYLEGKWYVTHAGLLRLARRNGCSAIQVSAVREFCDPGANRWVFKAHVRPSGGLNHFVGYGDADPSNTSPLVRGCELRVAETRAVNRALRKAYGIGLCSVEELGSHPFSVESPKTRPVDPPDGRGSSNGQPRLRDKLCLLIRNYELDPTLVKRYAVDFCGTETLREASRDLIEAFVSTISEEAANNRAALVCKLNSYNQPEEVRP
ncbi:MAG TPA: hypothetical protein VKB40_07000 [Candidatus Acidoferrales bacterium]|nr:hypothetical protein [Candidatus Acidoferrales bacterium]